MTEARRSVIRPATSGLPGKHLVIAYRPEGNLLPYAVGVVKRPSIKLELLVWPNPKPESAESSSCDISEDFARVVYPLTDPNTWVEQLFAILCFSVKSIF